MTLPRTPSFSLTGKRALVTGASSGIGQACAVAVAEAGAHVVCVARGIDKLQATVDEMTSNGWSAEGLPLDLSDLTALTDTLKSQAPFDVIVNAAGLARHGPALDTTTDDYDAVMDLNVRAAYFLSVGAAHGMKAAGLKGSIIHISSQMGHVGGIDRAVYCGTKHAVEGFTKAMAIEWGPQGIRVNTILPGIFETPLMNAAPPQVKEALAASVPFPKRLGLPGEYAKLAMCMIETGYFNGEDVRLDGAIRMAPR